jgi:hypothetical protein
MIVAKLTYVRRRAGGTMKQRKALDEFQNILYEHLKRKQMDLVCRHHGKKQTFEIITNYK